MMSSSFIPMKINIFSSDIGFLPNFWYFPNWTQFSFFNILLYYIIYAYPLTNEMIINWRASPNQANAYWGNVRHRGLSYQVVNITLRKSMVHGPWTMIYGPFIFISFQINSPQNSLSILICTQTLVVFPSNVVSSWLCAIFLKVLG